MAKDICKNLALALSILALSPWISPGPVQAAGDKTENTREPLSINTTEPYSDPKTSGEIVEVLKKMTEAIFEHDLDTLADYIDDHCTAVNARTGRVISGKAGVLDHLRTRYSRYSETGSRPLIGYEIDHPFVNIKDNQAVATYVANARIGGERPYTMSSRITEIFSREKDGQWKSIHYRCNWQDSGSPKGKEASEPLQDALQTLDLMALSLRAVERENRDPRPDVLVVLAGQLKAQQKLLARDLQFGAPESAKESTAGLAVLIDELEKSASSKTLSSEQVRTLTGKIRAALDRIVDNCKAATQSAGR
ncbi:MAG: nuclear transport factor 2 family protein [Cyanobacteria bacterium HKST-UBA02]|nr:nuclear transport factor 2 family protein [Cyanobacteria bacterium HKST-UBA02]